MLYRPLFRTFSAFSNKECYFTTSRHMWKTIHLISVAGIRTSDLFNMSLPIPVTHRQGHRLKGAFLRPKMSIPLMALNQVLISITKALSLIIPLFTDTWTQSYKIIFSVCFKNWAIPGLFFIYFRLFKKYYNSYNKYMCKNVITIQYTLPGFEPMTFGTWVSSHNH